MGRAKSTNQYNSAANCLTAEMAYAGASWFSWLRPRTTGGTAASSGNAALIATFGSSFVSTSVSTKCFTYSPKYKHTNKVSTLRYLSLQRTYARSDILARIPRYCAHSTLTGAMIRLMLHVTTVEFYRRYYKKIFRSLFFWTHCRRST